ncbi:hypothetical protein LX32DRAFT_357816 [Colletotrichum zoysiae]|uniref:Secreted protein n=1 Tax=Colletotrichum zoysiae TaxID=1216348 RepID=A0AAD9HJF7_9PEZI|nr:hypothetical protein LX32DRAFT_357816 [Colletotrichum zoysiae]
MCMCVCLCVCVCVCVGFGEGVAVSVSVGMVGERLISHVSYFAPSRTRHTGQALDNGSYAQHVYGYLRYLGSFMYPALILSGARTHERKWSTSVSSLPPSNPPSLPPSLVPLLEIVDSHQRIEASRRAEGRER